MQIAKCRLKLDRSGSDIPLIGVTPAEIMVLRAGHEITAGGDPVSQVEIIGESEHSNEEELARLKSKYGGMKVKTDTGKDIPVVSHLFPGATARLPLRFDDPAVAIKDAPKVKYEGPKSYDPEPEGGQDEGGSSGLDWDEVTPAVPAEKKK